VPYVATASAGHLADLKRKMAKARSLRGTRIVTLLIPCLDGWGLRDDAGLAAARLAVETGAFPLLEVEDGTRYTINSTKTRPIGEYLAIQRRYRHLDAEQVAALQAEIDEGWSRLQRQAALGAAAGPEAAS
jgi:pyruvate/2-oxoacid:ferredoxin oxidoreductase beta subunit